MFCRVEYFSQQTHSCQLAHPGEDDGIGGGIADFGVGDTNCTGEAKGYFYIYDWDILGSSIYIVDILRSDDLSSRQS